jgi:6-phosphogluconolactonase
VTDVRVLDDPATELAERLAEAAESGAHIALTGGSTPREAYQAAAGLGADWSRATLWWGDERCVPPDDEHSNFGMAKAALIDRLPADGRPAVHRIAGERGPSAAADDYERDLRETLGERIPRLNLVLLGLGADGHVASLFPNQPGLDERDRLAIAVDEPGLEPMVPRVTLTLPVINSARRILFLVTGEGKARAAALAFEGQRDPDVPASFVEPLDGTAEALLDPPAAALLRRRV